MYGNHCRMACEFRPLGPDRPCPRARPLLPRAATMLCACRSNAWHCLQTHGVVSSRSGSGGKPLSSSCRSDSWSPATTAAQTLSCGAPLVAKGGQVHGSFQHLLHRLVFFGGGGGGFCLGIMPAWRWPPRRSRVERYNTPVHRYVPAVRTGSESRVTRAFGRHIAPPLSNDQC